jgi:hypothetical protein
MKENLMKVSFEPLRPLGPANAFGYMGAIGLLEDPHVMRFVEDLRRRDGIHPPGKREGLEYNLGRYPLKKYEQEALPIARDYWFREMRQSPEIRVGQFVLRTIGRIWRILTGRRMQVPDLAKFLGEERLIATSARIIARHVIVDLLQVAEPINMPLAVVLPMPLDKDTEVLCAVICPGAEIEDVKLELGRQFEELTKRMGTRLPTKTVRTTWLRFVERTLARRKKLPKRNKYALLVEYAEQIWPGEEPPSAETLSKTNGNFERFKDRFFRLHPDPEYPTNTEK